MKFRVRATAMALIEEWWIVEALTREEAAQAVLNGDETIEFVRDSIIGEEDARHVEDADVVPE
jgi:hypothetical protein